jgi:hypothetical protein
MRHPALQPTNSNKPGRQQIYTIVNENRNAWTWLPFVSLRRLVTHAPADALETADDEGNLTDNGESILKRRRSGLL